MKGLFYKKVVIQMYICPKCLDCFADQYELFEHLTLCGADNDS